jgi:hypothetical protein
MVVVVEWQPWAQLFGTQVLHGFGQLQLLGIDLAKGPDIVQQ